MPNQNKQEEWEQIKRWIDIQGWLDYLVKVGYINAKFDIDSLLQQEREKAVREKVGEIRKDINNCSFSPFENPTHELLSLPSLQIINNNKE